MGVITGQEEASLLVMESMESMNSNFNFVNAATDKQMPASPPSKPSEFAALTVQTRELNRITEVPNSAEISPEQDKKSALLTPYSVDSSDEVSPFR